MTDKPKPDRKPEEPDAENFSGGNGPAPPPPPPPSPPPTERED